MEPEDIEDERRFKAQEADAHYELCTKNDCPVCAYFAQQGI